MAKTELQRPRNCAPESPTGRRWASLQEGADHVGVGVHTLRDWISKGLVRGYRMNARVIRVDLNELDAAMKPFGGAA